MIFTLLKGGETPGVPRLLDFRSKFFLGGVFALEVYIFVEKFLLYHGFVV